MMTKARDVVSRIRKAAKAAGVTFTREREGGRHTIYALGNLSIPIPRHREIGEGLTEKIYKECESELGTDWWR